MNDNEVKKLGSYLCGKKIALCVTGSVAAIESPKIARALRRCGAEVRAYTTPAVKGFVGELSLEWGTKQKLVSELSGSSEHICLEDLVLVAPATESTINKIFCGIADNSVNTLVASALGMGKPVCLAPSMHMSLYKNPILKKNLKKAEKIGIRIIEPRFDEDKAKIARTENIVAEVTRQLSQGKLREKKILVTAGPTREYIDAVRFISNSSTGALGVKIAKELYHRGADVKLVFGLGSAGVPEYLDRVDVRSVDDMLQAVSKEIKEGDYDAVILSAAVLDLTPAEYKDLKIKSGNGMGLQLMPTKKIIKEIDALGKKLFKVSFKLEYDKSLEELLECARSSLVKNGSELVVANDLKQIRCGEHIGYLVSKNGYKVARGKDEIARAIAEELEVKL